MKTTVVVATRDPHRQSEGLRAALGVTLRGADVTAVTTLPVSPLARRSIDTLAQVGGHRVVEALDLDGVDAVEIWTGPEPVAFRVNRGERRILHVVRGAAPEGAVADDDDVVYLSGDSPDYDRLVSAAFANELVVTW